MPQRNSVPTLKLLCIRTIAWPEGLTRKGEKFEAFVDLANAKSSKMTLFGKLFGRKDKNKSRVNVKAKKFLSNLSQVDGLADAIVNAWIRISNYYGARVSPLQQMNRYLSMRISALDFLHEQSILRSGLNLVEVGGLIPVTLVPQYITPGSWIEITEALKSSGNTRSMRCLLIPFKSDRQSPAGADFKFMTTISSFPNLTKIVVTGSIDNSFMKAVGVYCDSLIYLDIRGCSLITDTGILLLIFKRDPEAVMSWLTSFLGSVALHYPSNSVRPLTKTLQYFDMSTVPASDPSLDIPEIVGKACPLLVATPDRFFYYPGGTRVFLRRIELMPIQEIKAKLLNDVHCMSVDALLILVKMVRHNFQFGLTQIEMRSEKQDDNECVILFYYMSKVIVHLVAENLTVLSLTTFTRSVFDFVSLEVLAQATPQLRHLKAPLKGQLTREHALADLKSVTSPLVHSVDTLNSIFLFCFQLEYLEVREIFTSSNGQQLNDFDVHEMMLNGPYPSLEIIRFLFSNDVTLVTGVKEITFNCPALRLLGDMKHWQAVPFNMLSKFLTNMGSHNFDFGFEFDGVLYSTSSVCPEFRI